MKLRFFSTLSVLIASTALLPTPSLATGSVSHTASTQKHSLVAFTQGTDATHIHRRKQMRTTVDVFPGGSGNTGRDFPLDGSGITITGPLSGATATNALTLHHTRQGATAGHTEQYANYKTWGGSNWQASINSAGVFTHTQQGAGTSHTDTIINYISWDGQAWTATINPTTKVFTHTRRGSNTSHSASILNYVSWDGSQWTMRLQ